MEKGKIIFLNGTTSSGKTSLSKALQNKLVKPFYHISCDMFDSMAPHKEDEILFSSYLETSVSAMHHTIKLYSDLGINTIVDHVILDNNKGSERLSECINLLYNYPVIFVRVDCPLNELERREKLRGDRWQGFAKWQLESIHGHGTYDITVNTYENTLEECADTIIEMLSYPEKFTAFKTLWEQMQS
ncbi:MAG: chloramphenicol phosphotransferase CPT family protein [Oscillospiraceae bacterium]|nr:chloramphenicol phosphotransferase CPT family protein [Oscillospiraceae bacterium]